MFSDLFMSRSRTSLNGYEKLRLPFHLIRTSQLVSSFIVFAIMAFFNSEIVKSHMSVPWTFKVLMAVSVLTVISLASTIYFHLHNGLNPYLNLSFNTLIFTIWTMGFGMLSWYMWGTLRHTCDIQNWQNSSGIMICQIYKTLFTFALLGVVSTLCALLLDLQIARSNTSTRHFALSQLNPLNGGGRDRKRASATTGPYTDIDHQFHSQDNLNNSGHRDSEAFEVPKGYGKEGYEVPEQQFDYETGYYGGHAERVFGAK